MADILDILNVISRAQYGRDVRQAIVDGISQCYADGKAGVNDLQARQLIESAIAVNEDQQTELMNLLSRIEELEGGGSGEGTTESTTIEVPSFIIDSGIIDNITIESNGTNSRTITFSKEFTEIPAVSCAVMVQQTATSNYANVQVVVVKSSISTTGFKFTIANRSGAQRSATIGWIAIQPTTETIPLDITIPEAEGMSEQEVREITNPIQTAVDGVKTGYDGTVYSTPGEAVRTQINDLHVLIGDEPGAAISGSSVGYDGTDSGLSATDMQSAVDEVADALSNTNERLANLEAITLKTVPSTDVIVWEQGNLKPNTGWTNSSSVRIRTPISLPSNVYKISVNDDGYRINIYGYNASDGTFAGMWMGTEFKPYSSAYTLNYSEFDMSNAVGYRVKLTLLKTDGTDITPTDAQYVDFDIPLVDMDEINGAIESTDEKVEALKTEVIKTVTSDGLFEWQQGNLKPNDGTSSDSSLVIRTKGYIPSNVRKLTVTDSAYRIWVYGYSASDRTFLGLWNGTTFVAYSASGSYSFSGFDMSDADGNLVRITLKRADGTEITVSDAVYLSCDVPVADVDAITTEIEDIESNIYSEVESPELMLWSQGNFNANTGGETSSTVAIRTGYVDKSILSVRLTDTDHRLSIYGYNNGAYVGMWDGSRFRTDITAAYAHHTSFNMKDAGENEVRFRITRADGENILPTEGESLVCKVMAYTVDDSTPTEYTGKEISVFDNILCIGDSLIAGGGNRPAGIEADQSKASRTVVGAMYSIPTQLSKMYGMETTNWGISGSTTESWYNHYSAQSWSGHDAALIYIGSNDYNYVTTQGLTIEEGAEKSYTYLKNIISKLKTDNVGIRIFLCTLNPGSTKGTYAQYRIPLIAKMRQIANEEPSVFLIDMNTYGTLETYSPYHNGHPTPIGYNLMAKEMGSYISWTINNRPQSFKWIRWIGTEYAVGDNDTPTGDLPDVG